MPFYGIDVAVGDPEGGVGTQGAFRHFSRAGNYTPGTATRFQITRQGGRVTLAIPAASGAGTAFELSKFGDLFDRSEAYLFLSNSSEGTRFSNASLRAP
jgi:hypothetical protein